MGMVEEEEDEIDDKGQLSIQFPNYFFGTLFGFLPGTFAYVYAGSVGGFYFVYCIHYLIV
jgi:uncharacterized membrane protein YdjX (TVP38/TMEM64 family)